MTKEEALIYLPVGEGVDVEDIFEEKLFEAKQFFLTRFPLTKLIHSRLSKFQKIEQAYIFLGGQVAKSALLHEGEYPEFNSIEKVYKWYNIEKNKLRLQISSAQSHEGLLSLLTEYIRLTRYYAGYWKVTVNEEDKKAIKIGREPNPMDLQIELNSLNNLESLDSEYISSLSDDNCLKTEAKRLSLWLNFELNEQSIR